MVLNNESLGYEIKNCLKNLKWSYVMLCCGWKLIVIKKVNCIGGWKKVMDNFLELSIK